MIHGSVIIFLLLASVFALVHVLAITLSLYWFHWWFDILMHFWGGALIGLGIHALSTLPKFILRPTTMVIVVTLLLVTVSWEIFEQVAGLYDPTSYVIDTIQDIILGFGGGLLSHFLLRAYRMK
jgi:predicted dehydrogenase